MRLQARVINLDRDTARMARMAARLDALGIAFERFAAVDGRNLPDWLVPLLPPPPERLARPLTPGEIGCYASHLELARRCLEGDADAMLVMEDDQGIADDLPELLAACDRLPAGWHLVRLSGQPRQAWLDLGALTGGRHLARYLRAPIGTGAYLVSRAGCARLLAMGAAARGAVDEDMRAVWRHGLDTYGIVPPPFDHNAFGASSIDAAAPRAQQPKRRLAGMAPVRALSEAARRLAWQVRHMGLRGWAACLAATAAAALAVRRTGAPVTQARLRVPAPGARNLPPVRPA